MSITIPPEALEKARGAFTEAMLSEPQQDPITAAIRAALAAWPGMWVEQLWEAPSPVQGIILPLPQEKTDE